jgi:hypothetical protein
VNFLTEIAPSCGVLAVVAWVVWPRKWKPPKLSRRRKASALLHADAAEWHIEKAVLWNEQAASLLLCREILGAHPASPNDGDCPDAGSACLNG